MLATGFAVLPTMKPVISAGTPKGILRWAEQLDEMRALQRNSR